MVWGTTAMTRMLQAGCDLAETGVKAGEMAQAAHAVIGRRTAIMAAAVGNPWLADYAELNRMAPEKLSAFSMAGGALLDEWVALQSDVGAYLTFLGGAALTGRPPTALDVADLIDRTAHHGAVLTARLMGVAAATMDPIHERATANARRLARGSRRRSFGSSKARRPADRTAR